MQPLVSDIPETPRPVEATARTVPPFGANEMRLSAREWLITVALAAAAFIAIPRIWEKYEAWTIGPDYRIPVALSNDYWLFQRRLERIPEKGNIPIVGDSVVWGEFVLPDGTLSHFLGQQTGQDSRFVNCGMNGMSPLALEGLIKYYGRSLRDRKVIVLCNVLWMSNSKADLSAASNPDEVESINHSRLLPQFYPRIPFYHADGNERISAAIEPHVEFFAWATHLQNAYFDQQSIPQWTLKEDANKPPHLPNAWRNPLSTLTGGVPGEPANDPLRGPASKRHKPWSGQPSHFDWVPLDRSLQWQAFQRLVQMLQDRGNDVCILVGPFNEHMIAEDQRHQYEEMRAAIGKKLEQLGAAVVMPETLPTGMYADASHPLTEGYELLASRVAAAPEFRKWLAHLP